MLEKAGFIAGWVYKVALLVVLVSVAGGVAWGLSAYEDALLYRLYRSVVMHGWAAYRLAEGDRPVDISNFLWAEYLSEWEWVSNAATSLGVSMESMQERLENE